MTPGPVSPAPRVRTLEPSRSRMADVVVLERAIHQDPRGLLVETMRRDDGAVHGEQFAMTYTSVTIPGEKRDKDRWHVHQHQQDRFIVPLGEMVLALFDPRPVSRTKGLLELLRMAGPAVGSPSSPAKRDVSTHMVTIPEGVYHCIGNLHPTDPFVLQNFPTRLFDPTDEGRVLFADAPIAALGGRGFSWDLVEVVR
jgi:dTDP-4-dehydrorhamnose 3,5-epimerase-like enzyme